jgi:hypothetical protein
MKDITLKRMKLHKDLIKLKNFFAIHMKTRRIELIDYFFFRRVFIVLTSNCFCYIQNKRFETFYSFAKIDQRIVNACCATTKRRIWKNFWISRRI